MTTKKKQRQLHVNLDEDLYLAVHKAMPMRGQLSETMRRFLRRLVKALRSNDGNTVDQASTDTIKEIQKLSEDMHGPE